MSKFAKPAAAAAIIAKAQTDDGAEKPSADVRFSLDIVRPMADAIDASRAGTKITRVAWIREAIAERLAREARRAQG